MIFDSHAHYDDKQFAKDRDELLSSMGEYNIGYIVNVGASLSSTKMSIELAQKYDDIYAAIGVHPSDISDLNEDAMIWLEQQTGNKKIVAIGEIGLDYYWDKEQEVQRQQQYWFRRQLELARASKLPVIIHSRDAAADTLTIMKACAGGIPGVIHCFSYAPQMAMEYVDIGFYIGIGGVITFKNAKKLRDVAQAVPIERIVVETDCPYLAPEPYRGKRNQSQYLTNIIAGIAAVKGMNAKEVEEITCQNAKDLYGIR